MVRVLLLYGSLRPGSVSRLLVLQAERVLRELGAECRVFGPEHLPLHGSTVEHPAASELLELYAWCNALVWCTPEAHGTLSAVLKNQLDWLPPGRAGQETSSAKPLALLQVSGGIASFNALNTMRLVARHMHLLAIPGQLSIGQAYRCFTEGGRLSDPELEKRLVDVLHQLYALSQALRPASIS